MFRLYDLFISLMTFGMWVLSLFNEKIRKGFKGRKESLQKVIHGFTKTDRVIWMHAASLGEYLQGLPVLEKLKEKYPENKILITFFSPSGYENVMKKDNIADVICYLPFDQRKTLKTFCNAFQPVLFFTVKYDFWYRLLEILKEKKVPIYVVSALFYENQSFFKAWGKLFVNRLKEEVTLFFHQTKDALELARSLGLTQSLLSGDTRVNRVKKNVENFKEVPGIVEFISKRKVLVVGSSWEAEENITAAFAKQNPEIKIILAPHDLKRIPQIVKNFDHYELYSELKVRIKSQEQRTRNQEAGDESKKPMTNSVQQTADRGPRTVNSEPHSDNRQPATDNQILIIDSIGLLSGLYHYADVALVGGGFHSAGLHNVLEAAAFGVPVLFGDQYKKNPEADDLINAGGGKKFSTVKETVYFLKLLFSNEAMRLEMSKNSKRFIAEAADAAQIVLDHIGPLS